MNYLERAEATYQESLESERIGAAVKAERERVLGVIEIYLDDCCGVDSDMAREILKGVRSALKEKK